MASIQCRRCLSPSLASFLSSSHTAPQATVPNPVQRRDFSTTPSARVANTQFGQKPVAKKGVHRVAGKKIQVARKERSKFTTPLASPGERKAFRKRIVLSNNNALPVLLGPAHASSFSDPENVGKILSLQLSTSVDRLRTAAAFKPTQSWPLFHRPAVLVRKETVDLCQRMNAAIGDKRWLRIIISGDRVAGKSILMLQAMAHAYENNWIVLHIPEGQELVINHTDYAAIENSELWAQPAVAQMLCRQLSSNNSHILSKLQVSKRHTGFGTAASERMNMNQLCNASQDLDDAWAVWSAVWYELTEVPDRPPLIFALDGLSHIMRISDYRTKNFEPIHAHDLAIVRGFVDLLSGRKIPTGGGAVLGVMDSSNRPVNKSVDFAINYKEALLVEKLPPEQLPQRDPFSKKYDPRVDESLRDADLIKVAGIDKKEARAIMEYWAASGVFRHPITERVVTDTWALGGHGILGEMERAGLFNSRV